MQRSGGRVLVEEVLQNEGLQHAHFNNWQDALQTVTRLWRRNSKLVLVLDELQWTAEASPELPSILQGLWDREWKHGNNLMVIDNDNGNNYNNNSTGNSEGWKNRQQWESRD